MVLSLPIPWGPRASLQHCLPSCFSVSLCHFCSCFLLPTLFPPAPSVCIYFIFSSSFYCPLLPMRFHFWKDLSGAISPLVNKCCDRRQVGETLKSDYRRETPWNSSCSTVPRLIFLCDRVCLSAYACVCVCVHPCVCINVCMPYCLCNSQIDECRKLI